MEENEIIEKAKKRVEDKKGFYIHLVVFVTSMLFLMALNLLTSPGFLWFLIVGGSWLIGVAAHYVSVFGLGGKGWEERELYKEMDRIRRQEGRPTDDELQLEDDHLELKEKIKLKNDYDDQDLV